MVGASAGVLGFVLVMPFFYPVGRVFDSTVGGDEPIPLSSELLLGFLGGVILSPAAALIGGAVALMLNGRRIGPTVALGLIALGSVLAIGLLVALNGGFADEDGSLKSSVQWFGALGAAAAAVAIAFYAFAQNAFAMQGDRSFLTRNSPAAKE